jgi:transcriptional regulator with XRE-family HTH domain
VKKEDIAKLFNISRQTLNNWEKDKPELYKIVMKHFEEKKECPDLNNINYLKQEMIKAIDKLPEHKTKKFYHLMMAELAEMGI